MNYANPNELVHHGERALAFRNHYMGGVLLLDTVDPDSLPVRLREGFVGRPWPLHGLDEKLVCPEFIPQIPKVSDAGMWDLEIIGDEKVRIDGKQKNMRGNNLALLNLMFLTRDWHLRGDEYFALGFADYLQTLRERTSLLDLTRSRLRKIAAPHTIFERRERAYSIPDRLNQAVRILDLR